MHIRQAESELSDEKKREEIDAVIHQARILVLKANQLPGTTPLDDARVKALKPPFKDQVRLKSKEMLIDEEVRRRKFVLSSSSEASSVANCFCQGGQE